MNNGEVYENIKKESCSHYGRSMCICSVERILFFYQTKLIDSLKENYLQYSLLLVTVLFFVGNVVANLCENYVREREFYSLSVRTKAKAAKNYFMQPVHDDCGEPVINIRLRMTVTTLFHCITRIL